MEEFLFARVYFSPVLIYPIEISAEVYAKISRERRRSGFCSHFQRKTMTRKRERERDFPSEFTGDSYSIHSPISSLCKDKDGEIRSNTRRDFGRFRDRQGNTTSSKMLLF